MGLLCMDDEKQIDDSHVCRSHGFTLVFSYLRCCWVSARPMKVSMQIVVDHLVRLLSRKPLP